MPSAFLYLGKLLPGDEAVLVLVKQLERGLRLGRLVSFVDYLNLKQTEKDQI